MNTLVHLRQQRELTQEALARLADTDQTTISALERGKVRAPRWKTIRKLAAALLTDATTIQAAITAAAKRRRRRRTPR